MIKRAERFDVKKFQAHWTKTRSRFSYSTRPITWTKSHAVQAKKVIGAPALSSIDSTPLFFRQLFSFLSTNNNQKGAILLRLHIVNQMRTEHDGGAGLKGNGGVSLIFSDYHLAE